uniref:VASt domain-containing protein n=1 Tax=Daucus carota subsp. sativus TaxID=79200 RepID=A0A175YDZ2_DAUCS
MAVASPEITELPQSMASQSTSQSASPDRSPSDLSSRSPSKREIQVLIQDFNCALQESFILQKIIPFEDISSVRRAKTAGLFPTAIEITAAGKKFFFSSFLSRDEALKLIEDGWSEHGNGAKSVMDQQDVSPVLSTPENGSLAGEQPRTSNEAVDELESSERNNDVAEDYDTPPGTEAESVSTSSRLQINLEKDAEDIVDTSSSPAKSMVWEPEDSDAPKVGFVKLYEIVFELSFCKVSPYRYSIVGLQVPECYTMVAEGKFPLEVDEFFNLFLSDNALDFLESYHNKCGDKELKCSPWRPHEKYGHARDVSFKHPIKIYLGARYGSPRKIQKLRVYRNSHLIVETTQEISDVPYGDYFCVEEFWDVERIGDGTRVRIYINVAFSKNTMWKGKIVQSTIDECRDAYATWIAHAHASLQKMDLEKEGRNAANLIADGQVHVETQEDIVENSGAPHVQMSDSYGVNQDSIQLEENFRYRDSVLSFLRGSLMKLGSYSKSHSQFPSVVVIIVAAIFLLMQISIIVLLARPQQIHVVPQANYLSSMNVGPAEEAKTMLLLDKQISHLKEEMLMVETLLEKMQLQHALLKAQLQDVLRDRMNR